MLGCQWRLALSMVCSESVSGRKIALTPQPHPHDQSLWGSRRRQELHPWNRSLKWPPCRFSTSMCCQARSPRSFSITARRRIMRRSLLRCSRQLGGMKRSASFRDRYSKANPEALRDMLILPLQTRWMIAGSSTRISRLSRLPSASELKATHWKFPDGSNWQPEHVYAANQSHHEGLRDNLTFDAPANRHR